MSRLQVEFVLQSPTCIAQRPTAPGQISETASYLTGTVLRGGIAGLWLDYQRLAPQEQDSALFEAIFIQGGLRFHNAWPSQREGRSWVVPASAWSMKRNGGWAGDGKSGVQDVLADLLRPEPIDESLDRVGDEFVLQHRRSGNWQAITARRRLISRTALGQPGPRGAAGRGVAAEGRLYSFEALETGQRFQGLISGPDELIQALRGRLERDTLLSLGQGRSRGMGQVLLVYIEEQPEEERVLAHLVEQALLFSARAGAPPNIAYLPVTLDSDTILRDNYLLPCSSGEPSETLARYLAEPPATLSLHTAIQSTRWIGGWEELRRLPRPPQLVVTQGSIWIYQVAIHELEAAVAWWLALEQQGLGERCAEGFGQVRLLHPLHTEEGIW